MYIKINNVFICVLNVQEPIFKQINNKSNETTSTNNIYKKIELLRNMKNCIVAHNNSSEKTSEVDLDFQSWDKMHIQRRNASNKSFQ